MKKQDKIFEVENLAQKIKEAQAVALADYKGLTAAQAVTIRSQIKKSGGELQVVKNRLLLRALQKADLAKTDQDLNLEGPTMALFANTDPLATLKILTVFGKANDRLTLKFGFFEGLFLNGSGLLRIASLPGRDELRVKLVGLLAQPAHRLVFGLNFNLQKLVHILKGISDKKAN